MKAIRIGAYGGPEVLTGTEMPVPTPGAQDVVVRVAAIGVSFDDVLDRTGETERPLPFIPGSEAAGTIVALGSQVADRHIGERVACLAPAAYAEQLVAPQEHVVPIPDGLDDAHAAAAVRDGVLAHALITSAHAVREGEVVLVRPAMHGPGLCLIQLAKQRGARVIAAIAVPDAEGEARRLGADEIFVWQPEEVVADVRRLTDGAGVDIVFDGVGNDEAAATEWELDCLRPRGHLVLFGQAPYSVEFVNFNRLSGASLSVTSAVAPDYFLESGEFARVAGLVLDQVASGTLQVPIAGTFPLGEVVRAHQLEENPATTGKVILLP